MGSARESRFWSVVNASWVVVGLISAVITIALAVWPESHDSDRPSAAQRAYAAANRRLLRTLPVYPDARRSFVEDHPGSRVADVIDDHDHYVTDVFYTVARGRTAQDVRTFFRHALPDGNWRVTDENDGPIVTFRRGRATVSILTATVPDGRFFVVEVDQAAPRRVF